MKLHKHALIVAIAACMTAMAAQATEFRSADIHPDDHQNRDCYYCDAG